jgi:pimeloyl-ACP methyl ester carboxylesterase
MVKWVRRLVGLFLVLGSVLFLIYLLGPRPDPFAPDGSLPAVTDDLSTLEAQIQAAEARVPGLKPDNEARIVWADPDRRQKTPVSMVYLHGFGASQGEGRPVHTALAEQFGCNLYLARLAEHGIDRPDAFSQLTANRYLDSAKEAIAVGKALGDEVILVATSTGASLALYIASQNPDISAVVAYSPFVDLPDGMLFIPRGPWGYQLTSLIMGNPVIIERDEPASNYWSRVYSPEAYISLSTLIGGIMVPEVFKQVTCPVFVGIYYKSEEEQDKIVSVPAIRTMFDQLGTPSSQKVLEEFPEAAVHVIASDIRSEDWQGVLRATVGFLENIVGLKATESVN